MNPTDLLTVTDENGNSYTVDRRHLEPVNTTEIGDKSFQVASTGGYVLLMIEDDITLRDDAEKIAGENIGLCVSDVHCGEFYYTKLDLEEAEILRDELNEVIKQLKGL